MKDEAEEAAQYFLFDVRQAALQARGNPAGSSQKQVQNGEYQRRAKLKSAQPPPERPSRNSEKEIRSRLIMLTDM
jgi:hypothetical protein